jgi:hypothetical protein
MSDLYLIPERNLEVSEWQLAYAKQNSNQSSIKLQILADNEGDSDALHLDTEYSGNDLKLSESAIYWSAPNSYTGNKVTSYGGRIEYSLKIRAPQDFTAQAQTRPDLILVGANNMSLIYTSVRQPASNEIFTNKVDLLESQFTHLLTGSSASREHLMSVLAQLNEIKLR